MAVRPESGRVLDPQSQTHRSESQLKLTHDRLIGRPLPLRHAFGAISDLLLPIACVACGRLVPPEDSGIVCGACWSRVEELPYPRCYRCGHPGGRFDCSWCELLPPFVRAARSFCWMPGGTGSEIIHSLKYAGWVRVAGEIAERLARLQWPIDVVEERTALVPVPLATGRERERGFNQSAEIGRRLAELWRIPCRERMLTRDRATRSQTELTPGERLSNVAGAFRLRENDINELAGAHIILVDDVITTGATLGACATALFEAGARTISYITFGRAPAAGDRPQR
jgi:ComF family protein